MECTSHGVAMFCKMSAAIYFAPSRSHTIEILFTPSDNITIRAVDNSDVNWGVYFDTTVTVPLDFQEDSYSEIDEWFVGVYTGEVQIVMVRDTSIPW